MKNFIGNFLKKHFPHFYKNLIFKKEGRYQYKFRPNIQYPDSFINKTIKAASNKSEVRNTIFCFWTGKNEMSDNRKRGIQSLHKKTGVSVTLITPDNLQEYILKDYPLHPGYELLSLVHKSDYLRCYFMHHYGGGYADIKTFHYSWEKAFKKLKANPNQYIIGYPEIGGIAPVGGKLYDDLKFHYVLLIGNCAYICKSYTDFTTEWYTELQYRMNENYEKLIQYKKGNLPEYPIPYTYLLGQIFHPLSLKYHKKLLKDRDLMPDFKDYH